jgi:hypothetical protein
MINYSYVNTSFSIAVITCRSFYGYRLNNEKFHFKEELTSPSPCLRTKKALLGNFSQPSGPE